MIPAIAPYLAPNTSLIPLARIPQFFSCLIICFLATQLIVSRLTGTVANVTLCLVDNKKLLKRFSGEFLFSFKSKTLATRI
jgi:hypothetical protein